MQEAKRLFDLIKKGIKNINNTEVVICPPFVYLDNLRQQLTKFTNCNLQLGAQDCFWENPPAESKGAFTGEISLTMLKNLGCQYVILGHSERRQYNGETDEMINKKVETVLKNNLRVILCVGETEKERKTGQAKKILKGRLEKCLNKIIGLPAKQLANLIVVYEPVWAISPQPPCSVSDALKAILFLKKIVARVFNQKIEKSISFIYGGNITSQNVANFLKEKEINGVLLGSASLRADEFVNIVKQTGRNCRLQISNCKLKI